MDDKLNVSYITLSGYDIWLSGYVEMSKFRYLYFFILLTFYVLIIFSNCTIVYLIWIHKNLHEPMYIFIAALLFNSVLYSTTLYPKLLIDFLSEKQMISYSACLFQHYMFYTLIGAEFLLLAAMAYDRYVSICKPLRYATIMRKSTVSILLVLVWTLSASLTAVQTTLSSKAKICNLELKGIFCNNTMYTIHCARSRALTIFGVICLLNLVIFPMLFTVFTYTKIFIMSYRSCKEFRRKATETCLPHLLVLFSFSCLIIYDVIMARVQSDLSKTARFIMKLQIVLYHPLFNPFIYGLKMKEISKRLKKLFCSTKI